ncbi:formylmethanofuran dehydrogenase subunit E family protein [Maribacter polysaccharolyticus]|uniref:formylmethanofuran dehydrogenase subunit E family protein n=1 Tax=Maribacter polysaccharolyticus TaxID=3020831 RepID=UPI00237F76A0|nr:formylmethanofuran dehydrogenase subunit E family protein [Maribacter polysaccharolyticus]MDE3740251.1 formylmethanofuran dehydrogenase subunit E family protein [Maribacter polysaccharolyticus]
MKYLRFPLIIFFAIHLSMAQNSPVDMVGQHTGVTVLDTDFSKGRLTLEHQINLEDLERFHGHLCDGLIQGFLGIQEGLKILYPTGTIDRTNTRIVSNSSPCLTDVAIYITGGRYQYNSFYVDDTIEDGFYVLQRKDTQKAVKVQMKKGVKPSVIDELGAKAIKGALSPCDLDTLKNLEADFSGRLLTTDPKENFIVTEIVDFKWKPLKKNDYPKTDILNKNKSYCQ